jgi:hypothetical protein
MPVPDRGTVFDIALDRMIDAAWREVRDGK